MKYFILISLTLLFVGCNTETDLSNYESETLAIHKISDRIYQHVSYIDAGRFGKVACNGMIVTDGKEAIVFDTPTTDEVSQELINWLENTLGVRIAAVIPTHFHVDCLGGLATFHRKEVTSYAKNLTIELAKVQDKTIPQKEFDQKLSLKIGDLEIGVEYFGEGHTKDNVIAYVPSDSLIFGGCLIKALGAGKGNLEDANVNDWPYTVNKIKAMYPHAKRVIPGHGEVGSTALLDYTIQLFSQKE